MSLVETDWLEKNLTKVKIIDCSWHMPQTQRSGFEEYKSLHIPSAIFFDIDENSRKDTALPHIKRFALAIQTMLRWLSWILMKKLSLTKKF